MHGRWWDPLGLYGRVEQMREAARRRSPWYWSELYDQLGDTYQYTVAGARTITTRDPKNIKVRPPCSVTWYFSNVCLGGFGLAV